MTTILFVDDEGHVLDALRRTMRSMRTEWNMRFALSGAEALAQLAEQPAEVVVSDMRMPGMSGREMLEEVKRLYPATARFILSGHTEPSAVLQAAAAAHQYLAKPCDATLLKAALRRVHTLKELLVDDTIASWAAGGDSLPSLPDIYQRIVSRVQTPGASVKDVARVIEEDLAMSAMLLKVANSAYFGAGNTVRTTERAVAFLGIDNVASLVLAKGVVTASSGSLPDDLDVTALWNHSLATAAIARSLAQHEAWPQARADDAFLAGMLHDIGHMIMATAPRLDGGVPNRRASHERAGAYLVGLWGFPSTIVEAIAFHHHPSRAADPGVALPGILHAANAFASEAASSPGNAEEGQPDEAFLEIPQMRERWETWRECITAAGDSAVGL